MIRGQNNTNAFSDLTKIHNELLFSTRIALIPYEKLMDFQTKFKGEFTAEKTGENFPAGEWASLSYL